MTWTLTCELGFYTLVALGILIRPLLGNALLVGAAAALAFASLANLIPVLRWFFDFWPEFTCGLLAFAAVSGRRHGGLGALPAMTVATVALVAWCLGRERVAAVAALGLGLVALWPCDNWLASQRPLRWLAWVGTLSYPLFLLHVPVASRVLNLGRRFVRSDSLAFGGVIAAALALSVAVAWAVERWVDQPLQTLAKPQPAPAT